MIFLFAHVHANMCTSNTGMWCLPFLFSASSTAVSLFRAHVCVNTSMWCLSLFTLMPCHVLDRRSASQEEGGLPGHPQYSAGIAKGREALLQERELREAAESLHAQLRAAMDEQVHIARSLFAFLMELFWFCGKKRALNGTTFIHVLRFPAVQYACIWRCRCLGCKV